MNPNIIMAWVEKHKKASHIFASVVVGIFTLYIGVDSFRHFVDTSLAHYPRLVAGFATLLGLYLRYSDSLKKLAA